MYAREKERISMRDLINHVSKPKCAQKPNVIWISIAQLTLTATVRKFTQ